AFLILNSDFCLPGVIGRGRSLCPTLFFPFAFRLSPFAFFSSVFCLLSSVFFFSLFPFPFSLFPVLLGQQAACEQEQVGDRSNAEDACADIADLVSAVVAGVVLQAVNAIITMRFCFLQCLGGVALACAQ